jgi:phosphate transport system protein
VIQEANTLAARGRATTVTGVGGDSFVVPMGHEPEGPRMSKHLQRDLDYLQRDLITLAASVEEQLHNAVKALRERQPSLARQVIDGDNAIDQEENHIEEECLKLLALHQPVAKDLRRITAALKINAELERMGDLAESIADRALSLTKMIQIPIPAKLDRMTDLATTMVRQSLDAFVNLDARLARRVIRLDDEVDRYNDEIIAELIRTMEASSENVAPGLSFFSATRHLERIADYATNIAEDVVYLAEGEIIRHRPSALGDDETD